MTAHTLPPIGWHASATPARKTLALSSSISVSLLAGLLLLALGVGGWLDASHHSARPLLSCASHGPASLADTPPGPMALLLQLGACALALWSLARLMGSWRLLRHARPAMPAGVMLATGGAPSQPGQDVNLASESVAGEEDPGASLDMAAGAKAPGAGGSGAGPVSQPSSPAMNPGDEAPAGTPGTGENLCRECGGSGRLAGGAACPTCGGTGKVTTGVGGA